MELDILFWLAIGAIYLFQMFAGRDKRKQVPGQTPVPTPAGGHSNRTAGESARRDRASSGTSTGPPSPSSNTGQDQSSPTLQDALREISDILSGKPVGQETQADDTGSSASSASRPNGGSGPKRESPPKRRVDSEFKSPLRREKESAEQRSRRLAELRKKHRTHRTRPLGGSRSESSVLDEDAFERRSRPPRSSTYDDLFESPLYESFGDPIDHQELKVEILEPAIPVVDGLQKGMILTRADARRGIILSEILGPPVSKKRSR